MKLGKALFIFLGFIFYLSACLPLIDDNLARSMNDTIAPVITITSPAAGSACSNTVRITGTVTDLASDLGEAGKVIRLAYKVLATGQEGSCSVQADGSFQLPLDTLNLPGNFTLQFTAIDWNQNQGISSLVLQKIYENSIPSFTATPGNKCIDLSWEEIPNTAYYTLYYTTDGSTPSAANGKSISLLNQSSYKMNGLVNGLMHTFLLTSQPLPGWAASCSTYIKAIPLSPHTLTPQISGGYEEINISWNPIPGTQQFEVKRREWGSSNDFVSIKICDFTTFQHKQQVAGHKFEYQVLPYYTDCTGRIASLATIGETCPFPSAPLNSLRSVRLDWAYELSHIDNYVYVAHEGDGFQVIDISNPENANQVGTLNTGGMANRLVYMAPYAYVADGYGGMQIIRLTAPDKADIISSVNSSEEQLYINDVAVSGDYAYALAGKAGLQIIDVSKPAEAAIIENVRTAGYANRIVISGTYAYIADGGIGLQIVDIRNPEKAAVVRTVEIAGGAATLAIAGRYAYVGDQNQGLHIVDIADPNLAADIKQIDLQVSFAHGIAIDGAFAYVGAEAADLLVIRIDDPQKASVLKRVVLPGKSEEVAIVGTYAFVTTGDHGLQAVNIKNPCNPVLLTTKSGFNKAADLVLSGSDAYLANMDYGLNKLDISNPGNITATLPLPVDTAGELAVAGSYLYVNASTIDGAEFDIIDISKPNQPVVEQKINIPGAQDINSFVISGAYAYILIHSTSLEESLLIYDLSDPGHAEVVNAIELPAEPVGLAVSGKYAYIISNDSDLFVVEISEPELRQKSRVRNNIKLADELEKILIANSYIYVIANDGWAGTSASLYVLDTTNPDQIRLADPVSLYPQVTNLAISGSYAYITFASQSVDSGFQILDISDPMYAVVVKKVSSPDKGWDIPEAIVVTGQYAYVAVTGWGASKSGLYIYDLAPDPARLNK